MNLPMVIGLLFFLLAAPSQSTRPESRTFTHPNDEYRIQLLPEWDAVTYEARTREVVVDIVFRGQRDTALLKIEKMALPEGVTLASYVKERSESDYRLKPNFGKFHSENFGGGKLAGMLAEFEFTKTNKPMLARYYYLLDGPRTLWELRFTGNRAAIRGLRNETDVIVRSFVPGRRKTSETKSPGNP